MVVAFQCMITVKEQKGLLTDLLVDFWVWLLWAVVVVVVVCMSHDFCAVIRSPVFLDNEILSFCTLNRFGMHFQRHQRKLRGKGEFGRRGSARFGSC